MTPHLSEPGQASGCPCGRSHPPQGISLRKLRKPVSTERLREQLYTQQAFLQDAPDRFRLDYAGSCESPICVKQNDVTRLFVDTLVRCRRCKPCLRARTNYWGYAAMRETLEAQDRGLRTWFGTLSLTPTWQSEFLRRAMDRWSEAQPTGAFPDWWDDPKCDERFRLVRNELLPEVQKLWKRLRKKGYRFKYFLVFERHKSGLPHMHFLLHEQSSRITKSAIQAEWAFGFSNVSIVGGRSKNAAAPEKAAWYVVKYLSKSVQARQVASRLYRPSPREKHQSH